MLYFLWVICDLKNLEAKIVFLTSSPEIIGKCNALNIEVIIVEEYLGIGECWLQPEMLLNFQASFRENIDDIEEFPTQQIECLISQHHNSKIIFSG